MGSHGSQLNCCNLWCVSYTQMYAKSWDPRINTWFCFISYLFSMSLRGLHTNQCKQKKNELIFHKYVQFHVSVTVLPCLVLHLSLKQTKTFSNKTTWSQYFLHATLWLQHRTEEDPLISCGSGSVYLHTTVGRCRRRQQSDLMLLLSPPLISKY